MRNLTIFLFSLLLLTVLVQPAEARPKTRFDATTNTCRVLDHGPLEWASSAWGEGGREFKKVCQGCHFKGNDKGVPFLWAESKSSAAWNRVFDQKYPKCARDGSWDVLTREQQMEVNDYLYRFAKGSDDPGNGC